MPAAASLLWVASRGKINMLVIYFWRTCWTDAGNKKTAAGESCMKLIVRRTSCVIMGMSGICDEIMRETVRVHPPCSS